MQSYVDSENKQNGSSNVNQADKLKLGVMISKLHTAMANAWATS